MNIDRSEIFKCVEVIIGKDNLVSDPEISEGNVLIKVKKLGQIDIPEYEKQIAEGIVNFMTAPFGVIITKS